MVECVQFHRFPKLFQLRQLQQYFCKDHLKAIPIQQITQVGGAAPSADPQAEKLVEIAAKSTALQVRRLLKLQEQTRPESTKAVCLMVYENRMIWLPVAFKSVDVYLGIVNTILESAGHLTGVTGALNSIIQVVTSVFDLRTSSELTPGHSVFEDE